ncbi:hypothetical protein GW17_00058123, partial [Ensete ventricosum]
VSVTHGNKRAVVRVEAGSPGNSPPGDLERLGGTHMRHAAQCHPSDHSKPVNPTVSTSPVSLLLEASDPHPGIDS